MAGDVAAFELRARLGQDARHVQRHIAIADHHHVAPVQRRIDIGEIGMAVIPADEGRAAVDPGQIAARQIERAIVRRAGGQHHRVVKLHQLGDRDVLAHRDMADEAHIVAQRHLLVTTRDLLDRLVIGRDAEADEAEGRRQPIENIDPHILAERLLRGLRSVIARRARSDDRDIAHGGTLLRRRR